MLRGSYHNGFAPRDGMPLYPSLWRGCVGAWAPCLGPTGLTLRDWAAYKNHAAFTSMTASAWAVDQGRYSLALASASSNYLTITEQPALRLTGDKSGFAWIKCTTPGSTYRTVFSKDNTFAITVKNSIFITFDWNAATDRSSGVNVATGNWTHIGWTIRAGVASGSTFYVNGASVGTFTYNTQSGNRSGVFWDATIGTGLTTASTPASEYFNGSIDDIMLYNRVLNANEVRLLASRRGIAYDLAPMAMPYSEEQLAAFKAAWALRQRLIIGGGGGLG